MVGLRVGRPTDVTRGAIIVHIQHAITVHVVVACIAVGITVEVGLVVVGHARAVVESVQHPVEVKVGFVQPHAHVVLVTLIERMGPVGTVSIGNERNDRRTRGTHAERVREVITLSAGSDGPVPRAVRLAPAEEDVVVVPIVHAVDVREGVITQHQRPRCFSKDERIALFGEMDGNGMVGRSTAKAGGVQPFSLRRDVRFVEINPDRRGEFDLPKGHVLQVIAHDSHTTVVATVAIGCR